MYFISSGTYLANM